MVPLSMDLTRVSSGPPASKDGISKTQASGGKQDELEKRLSFLSPDLFSPEMVSLKPSR